jgi:hypothetical protein
MVNLVTHVKSSLSPFLLTLILFLSIFTPPLYAEIKSIQSDEVVVLYEGQMKGIAEEVAGVYPAVKEELVGILKWDVDTRPDIVIAKDRNTFKKIVGSDIIVAFAVPRKNLIVLDISRIYTKPFSLETTLKHELCHLVLHQNIKKNNLPRWLDEGVCQWASGGVAELVTGGGDRALSQAIVSNNVIRIRSLDRFPQDGKHLLLAYEESKSFIEYIIREYGEHRLLQSLQFLKEGDSIDDSFERSFSVSFPDLEQKWLAYLQRKYTWFSYASNHLYTILFFLAGIVTLYGFFRLLKKKREYKDEEEEDKGSL